MSLAREYARVRCSPKPAGVTPGEADVANPSNLLGGHGVVLVRRDIQLPGRRIWYDINAHRSRGGNASTERGIRRNGQMLVTKNRCMESGGNSAPEEATAAETEPKRVQVRNRLHENAVNLLEEDKSSTTAGASLPGAGASSSEGGVSIARSQAANGIAPDAPP